MSLKSFLAVATATAALIAGSAEARSQTYDTCGSDEALSTALGAVIGGVIGGQFGNDDDDRAMGAVAGALIGGVAGNEFAGCDTQHGYDDSYEALYEDPYSSNDYPADYYDDTFETTVPYQQVDWSDPYTGQRGTIRPAGWYQDDRGNDCREFEQTIIIDGRRQLATGTACREPDGTWRIVE